QPILKYSDQSYPGIIEASDLTIGPTPVFAGSTYPETQYTIGSSLGLFHRHLTFSTLFDFRGGMRLQDLTRELQCYTNTCAALADPHTSLRAQAAAVALTNFNTPWGYFESGSFMRWRELSATCELPSNWAKLFHARSASITVSARNLALWTRYTGTDPEAQTSVGYAPAGAYQDAGGGLPPLRSFIGRINLGL